MKFRILLFSLASAATAGADTIVTGPESGMYHKVGTAISKVIEPGGYDYLVSESAGSVENVRRLFESIPAAVEGGEVKGRANLAIVQSDVLFRARSQDLELPEELRHLRKEIQTEVKTLLALYPEYVQIFVAEDSPIESMFQLADRIVFTGEDASGTRMNAEDIFKFLRIDSQQKTDGDEAEPEPRYRNVFTIADLREAHSSGREGWDQAAFDAALSRAVDAAAAAKRARQESGAGFSDSPPAAGEDPPPGEGEPIIDFGLAKELVREGLIDAAFTTQGSIVRENGLRHLTLPEDLISEFHEDFDWYGVRKVSLGPSVELPILFTRANLVSLSHEHPQGLSREAAEAITRMIYEGRFELASRVPGKLDFFVRDRMVRRVTDNLHLGSRDYFQSRNIIPRVTLWEWLLMVPLIVVGLIIVLNALRNRWPVSLLFRSKFVTRIYDPGSRVQKIWDRIYHYICGSWLWILVWVFIIIFAAVIYLIRYIEKQHSIALDIEDPFAGTTFWEAAFWMLTFATTGFHQDIYPNTTEARILAMIVPIGGILLTLFVLINRTFKSDREMEKRAQGVVIPKGLKNHIVVCGWNDRVPNLLQDLTSPSSPLKAGAKAVVIAETEEEKPLEAHGIDRKRVFFLRGRSSDYEKLKMANITKAEGAIVVAGNRKVEDNNNRSILTCTAIRHTLRKANVLDEEFPIIAELYYERNKAYFEESGVKKLVCLKTLSTRMISHAALNPGVSGLLLSLLRFSTEQVGRAVPVKKFKCRDKSTVEGLSFWEALVKLRQSGFLLLAVWREDRDTNYPSLEVEFRKESPYHFCPRGEDNDYRIKPVDKLLVVTPNPKREDSDIRFLREGTAQRFLFQKERVLIIGNGSSGSEIAQVISLRAQEVIQIIVETPRNGEEIDVEKNGYTWDEEKHGSVTVVRTDCRPDENFFRQYSDRLSHMTRAVILGPDRRRREKQSEIFHDDETIMHAKSLRRVAGEIFERGSQFHILAEMRCIDNLDLFHDSGIDQPVPTTALVEECLVQMVFHKGIVSEFFLKAMSYSPKNTKGRLKRMAMTTLEGELGVPAIGMTFDQLLEACAARQMQLVSIQKSGIYGAETPLVFNPESDEKEAYQAQKSDYVFILGQVRGETEAEGKEADSPVDQQELAEYTKSVEELKGEILEFYKESNVESVESGGAHIFVPPPEHADFAGTIASPIKEKQEVLNVCQEIVTVFEKSQNHAIRAVLEKAEESKPGSGSEWEEAIHEIGEASETNHVLLRAAGVLVTGGFRELFELHDLLRNEDEDVSDEDIRKFVGTWAKDPLPAEDGASMWMMLHRNVLTRLRDALKKLKDEMESLPKELTLPDRTVFISCSSGDRDFVEGTLLNILRDLKVEPWYYVGDISTGDIWQEKILDALKENEWFLVVVSEKAAASEHVKDEVSYAMGKGGGKILPIIIDDCDPNRLHLRMNRIQSADFREGIEAGKRQLERFFNQ